MGLAHCSSTGTGTGSRNTSVSLSSIKHLSMLSSLETMLNVLKISSKWSWTELFQTLLWKLLDNVFYFHWSVVPIYYNKTDQNIVDLMDRRGPPCSVCVIVRMRSGVVSVLIWGWSEERGEQAWLWLTLSCEYQIVFSESSWENPQPEKVTKQKELI